MRINSGEALLVVTYWVLDVTLLLLVIPFMLYDVQRMGYITPISFNEGWNAYTTTRFWHGEALYPPLAGLPVTPVSYPPLSFVLIGAVGQLTGYLIFAGRSVAFVSFLVLGVLIFWIIYRLSMSRASAALGALLWFVLMVRVADEYVGMYDPQLLGHVFAVGAMAFYIRWRDEATPFRLGMTALLCCLGLAVKPVLIAVPITLAIILLLKDRKQFGIFAFAGIAISVAATLLCWFLFGKDFFVNMSVELGREWRFGSLLYEVNRVMVVHLGIVLLAVLPVFLFRIAKRWPFAFTYCLVSLLTGVYFSGDHGVSVNAWFDFFIATSIGMGLLAGQLTTQPLTHARVAVCAILLASLLLCLANLRSDLEKALDYDALRRGAQTYRGEVELLRSTPGPVLFEMPSLGFDAGKEFLFDPFLGTELIETGRLPERVLTDHIRDEDFPIIALSYELRGRLRRGKLLLDRWTDNTVLAISKNYQLLDHRYSYLYVPSRH